MRFLHFSILLSPHNHTFIPRPFDVLVWECQPETELKKEHSQPSSTLGTAQPSIFIFKPSRTRCLSMKNVPKNRPKPLRPARAPNGGGHHFVLALVKLRHQWPSSLNAGDWDTQQHCGRSDSGRSLLLWYRSVDAVGRSSSDWLG